MARFENRNLVVCETFDDFSERVEKIDFDVENIVGLVTSLANVFYWLNVESVWGPLGFTWKVTDDYGVFNTTTVPFSIIPKLPDGERIKQLNNTFNSVSTDYIDLRKSNWENLYSLNNPWQDKIVKADLTGAKLTYVNNLLYHTKTVENNTEIKGLYLKADFSNVSYLNGSTGKGSNYVDKGAFIHIDDENKGMFNAPYGWTVALYYSGSGELKLEHFFRQEALERSSGGMIYVYSENGVYVITNPKQQGVGILPNRHTSEEEAEGEENYIPLEDEKAMELTVDGSTNGVIALRNYFDVFYNSFYLKPVILQNYESVDWINPFIVIRNGWPELTDEEMEKWEDSASCSFMPYIMLADAGEANACPYTLNVEGRKYLNIYNKIVGSSYGGNGCKITAEEWEAAGVEHYDYDKSSQHVTVVTHLLPQLSGYEDNCFDEIVLNAEKFLLYAKVGMYSHAIRTKKFTGDGLFFGKDAIIETSNLYLYNSYFYNVDSVHIRLFPTDGKMYFSGDNFTLGTYATVVKSGDGIVDYIEVETHDEEVLKASTIRTVSQSVSNYDYPLIYRHDFIVSNSSLGYSGNMNITIESDFVFIYASDVSLTTAENGNISYETIKKLIDGLVKDESGKQHSITLKSWIYSQLTDDEKSHIINDLGYTLVEQK